MSHIPYIQYRKTRKSNWIGHIWRKEHVKLPKNVTEGKRQGRMGENDEEEDVSSYWMILRKREGTGN